jgi:hypothetical protein
MFWKPCWQIYTVCKLQGIFTWDVLTGIGIACLYDVDYGCLPVLKALRM